MTEEFDEVLKKAKLFECIESNKIDNLLNCLKVKLKKYDKNNIIVSEEEKINNLSLILSGKVAVVKEKASGERTIITILSEGDIFGESIIFARNNKSLVNVIALDEVNTLSIEANRIISTCGESCLFHKQLILNVLQILAEKNIMLNKKIEYLSIKGMREKLSNYLFNQYKFYENTTFNINLNRNELADYLNVSRSSMSRELSKMKDDGIVEYHKNGFKIISLEELIKNI